MPRHSHHPVSTLPDATQAQRVHTKTTKKKRERDEHSDTPAAAHPKKPRQVVEHFTARHLDILTALEVNRKSTRLFQLRDTSKINDIKTAFTNDVSRRIAQMKKHHFTSAAFFIMDTGDRIPVETRVSCIAELIKQTQQNQITITHIALKGKMHALNCLTRLITPSLQRLVIHETDIISDEQFLQLKNILLDNVDRSSFQLLYGPPPKKCDGRCAECNQQKNCHIYDEKLANYEQLVNWAITLNVEVTTRGGRIICRPYELNAPEIALYNQNELFQMPSSDEQYPQAAAAAAALSEPPQLPEPMQDYYIPTAMNFNLATAPLAIEAPFATVQPGTLELSTYQETRSHDMAHLFGNIYLQQPAGLIPNTLTSIYPQATWEQQILLAQHNSIQYEMALLNQARQEQEEWSNHLYSVYQLQQYSLLLNKIKIQQMSLQIESLEQQIAHLQTQLHTMNTEQQSQQQSTQRADDVSAYTSTSVRSNLRIELPLSSPTQEATSPLLAYSHFTPRRSPALSPQQDQLVTMEDTMHFA